MKVNISEAYQSNESKNVNDEVIPVMDLQKEMQKTFMDEIQKCVQNHSKWKDPFYIVVYLRRPADKPNMIKQVFVGRRTRPAPDFDMSLFKYTPSSGDLEYCWSVPDKARCALMLSCPTDVPMEEWQLLRMVQEFADGKLV